MSSAWQKIAQLLLGVLFEFLVGFVQQTRKANADDPGFLERLYLVVTGIEDAHPDWSGAQKWDYAFEAGKQVAIDSGKTIRTSLLEALLGLAVVRLKEERGI